jgi:hypothetical protein
MFDFLMKLKKQIENHQSARNIRKWFYTRGNNGLERLVLVLGKINECIFTVGLYLFCI